MTFFDLIKSLIDSAKERLKTPIAGAFIWSFLIFNWRPIAVLFFSNAPIEDKIIVINHEYCTVWAIISPIIIALLYTILLPMVTLRIDIILKRTKHQRLDHRNEYIGLQKDGKINLAGKEWLLKNAESGNKEIEDRLDEIKSLKETIKLQQESIKQINQTNKATVEELNNSLKAANKEVFNRAELHNFNSLRNIILGDTLNLDLNLVNKVLMISDTLDFKDYKFLNEIDVSEINSFKKINNKDLNMRINNLIQKQIFVRNNNGKIELTEEGDIIQQIIRTS